MDIIDAGTPYQNWIANGLEAQYTQAMDSLNASHMIHPSNLTPGLEAPAEADSASCMTDGVVYNRYGVG